MSLFDSNPNILPSEKEAGEAAARLETARTASLGKQRLFAATQGLGLKDAAGILRGQGISRKRAEGLTINQAIKEKPKKRRFHAPPAPATEAQKVRKARIVANRIKTKARVAAARANAY